MLANNLKVGAYTFDQRFIEDFLMTDQMTSSLVQLKNLKEH